MVSFALDGITSFSAMPIRFISLLGFLIFLASIAFTLYTFAVKFFGFTVPGWSTLMASIWILGGLQLLALGIIGEYIGKIYVEVKARPRYIVEEMLD
jgi:glycosyltransferase involved in cell wall biosynthesis